MTRRTSRRPVANPAPQKGYPWRRDERVYHATIALDRVIDEGLRPRRDLGNVHAAGGGPDESISFTTDPRVAKAVAIGLRTLARAARGDLSLGELIIGLQAVAPKAVAAQLPEMRLTPEKVVRIDQGLVPVTGKLHMGFGPNPVQIERLMEVADQVVDLRVDQFAGASKPYAATGWIDPGLLLRLTDGEPESGDPYWYRANRCFEFYKQALPYGQYERELYDPFFMFTSPKLLSTIPLDQIGVVSATLDADWVCGDDSDMKALGFDISNLPWGESWGHNCEMRLRYETRGEHRTPPSGWAPVERYDTIVYKGAMSEVRVYDGSMIRNLRTSVYGNDELVDEVVEAWARVGKRVSDPLAYPYFKTRHVQMGAS